jgi:hypothetical protein
MDIGVFASSQGFSQDLAQDIIGRIVDILEETRDL